MSDMLKAKLRTENGLQIVVLPPDVHFHGDEVLVRQDSVSGDVVLSATHPRSTLQEFITFRDAHLIPDDEWDAFNKAIHEARTNALLRDEDRVLRILTDIE